jgi:hypothetical protein
MPALKRLGQEMASSRLHSELKDSLGKKKEKPCLQKTSLF